MTDLGLTEPSHHAECLDRHLILKKSLEKICSQNNFFTGGILTGNFGMWNAYCLVMMCLYAPSVPVTTTATEASHTTGGQSSPAADENDPTQLQKMLSKQSQE